MKKKNVLIVIGVITIILFMLLRTTNTPDDNEVLATDEISQEFHSTDTENDTLEDEYSVVEIETGKYIEDQVEEQTTTGSASEDTDVSEDDISYQADRNEILDSTKDRAFTYIYAAKDTNVYAEMSTESEIIGTVKLNDKLKTYGSVDGWYVIDYDGQDGFIQAQFTSPAQVSDSESTITK